MFLAHEKEYIFYLCLNIVLGYNTRLLIEISKLNLPHMGHYFITNGLNPYGFALSFEQTILITSVKMSICMFLFFSGHIVN